MTCKAYALLGYREARGRVALAPSTAVGRMYALPDELFAVPFLEIVSATTNSTGTAGIVSLKS